MPPEKIIGRKISDFFEADEARRQLFFYETCINEKRLVTFEYELMIENKLMYFEARLNPVNDQMLLAIVRDVTNQKQLAATHRDELNYRKFLFSNDKNGLVILNSDHKVTDVNPRFCEMTGYTADELLNMHTWDFEDTMTEKDVREGFDVVNDVDITFESRHRRRDGSNYEVEVSAISFRWKGERFVYCSCRDITQRIAAEKQLKESEEKYRMLFNANNDSISIFYIDENGKPSNFIEMNKAGAEIIGYTNEELLNINVAQLEEEVSDSVRLKRIDDIQRNGYAAYETTMRHKSGKKLAMEVKTILINYLGKPAILNIARDITERKKSEEALRASEYKFRHLVNNLHAGIVVHNPDTTILFSNPQAASLLGLTQYQLDGKDAYDPGWKFVDDLGNAIEPAEYPVLKVIDSKKAIKDKIYGIDRPATNDRVWVQINAYPEFDHDGKLSQVVVTFIDISGIIKAEEALRVSEEFNRRLLATIPDLVIRTDLEGNIVFVNEPGLKGSMHHTKEELLGRNMLSFIHEPDLERAVENTKRMFEKPLGVIEYKLQLEDGQLFDYEVNGDVVRDGDNNPLGMVYIVRNITQRKQAEEAILHGKQRLESFLEISRSITKTMDQERIMQMIVDNSTRIMGLGSGAIYLKNDEKTIKLSATTPALPTDFPDELRIASLENHPHIARSLASGSYVLMPDALNAELTTAEKEVIEIRGLRTNLYLPVRLREKSIGVLILSSVKDVYHFVDEEIEMLQGFANQAAHIIDNANNFDELTKYTKELENEISQRKEAETALRESEYFANAIANNTPALLYLWDIDSNRNIWSNNLHRQYFESFSESGSQLSGDEIQEIVHPNDFATLNEKTLELINNKETSVCQIEFRHKTKMGWKWMNAIISVFKSDEQGKATQILGALFDIDDRKKAEELLRQNEERFRQVAETNQTVIWELDTEGIYTYVSPMAEEIWGYKPEELVGKVSYFNLHPEEGRQEFKEKTMKFVTETGSFNNLINPIQKRDGSIIWVTTNGLPIFDEHGTFTGYRGSDQDITERLLAENELRKFKTISDQANYGTVIVDLDGNLIYVNDHFAQMHGWTANDLQGLNLTVFHNEEQLSQVYSLLEVLKAEGGFSSQELDHVRKDGSVFPTLMNASIISDENGRPMFMTATAIDISEVKAARLELLKLSQAVVQNPIGIVTTDINGVIEYANPKLCQMTGYVQQELIGQNCRIFNSGHHSGEVFENLWDTIMNGEIWNGELLNKKKNGELYWENVFISPIRDEQDHIINFVGIKEDVTDQKQLLEDLKIAKENAEKSDKLKSAFLNNVSHEVRTPLNGILGFGQIITEAGLSQSEKSEYLKILHKSTERLMNTITSYIDISLIVSGNLVVHKRAFVIGDFFTSLFNQYKPKCEEKNLELLLRLPEDLPAIMLNTDAELLRKALQHILDNAVQFTEIGNVEIQAELKGPEMIISVSDSGIGVDPAFLHRIFDVFVQEDMRISRNFEGSGLGLAIVKGFVTALGGRITIESEKGVGTGVKIALPYETEEMEVKKAETEKPKTASPLVLVAEDEINNYLYLEVLLKKSGIRVLHAVNGAEAVELCRQHPEINLVFMDIKMPVMDGLEATGQIKEFRKDLPIIAITAYAQTGDEFRIREAGCDDYLAKPVKMNDLKMLINKMLGS